MFACIKCEMAKHKNLNKYFSTSLLNCRNFHYLPDENSDDKNNTKKLPRSGSTGISLEPRKNLKKEKKKLELCGKRNK